VPAAQVKKSGFRVGGGIKLEGGSPSAAAPTAAAAAAAATARPSQGAVAGAAEVKEEGQGQPQAPSAVAEGGVSTTPKVRRDDAPSPPFTSHGALIMLGDVPKARHAPPPHGGRSAASVQGDGRACRG
jgi:hypothetical protein